MANLFSLSKEGTMNRAVLPLFFVLLFAADGCKQKKTPFFSLLIFFFIDSITKPQELFLL